MMYEFCKYADGTQVMFSDIHKNENEEEILYVHFERPTEEGFDSIRFELPSYKIVYEEGHYTDKEIAMFKDILERGIPYFYEWSREGGIKFA